MREKNELPLKSEALNPFSCQWLAWQNLLQPQVINPAENFKISDFSRQIRFTPFSSGLLVRAATFSVKDRQEDYFKQISNLIYCKFSFSDLLLSDIQQELCPHGWHPGL